MDSLRWDLEQLFCPPLDSSLIAAIVSENPDFDTCFDILSPLAEEANLVSDVVDSEGEENELSSNGSSIFRSSSITSSGETGDGSITSLECSIDGLSVGDELDYESTCSTADYDERNLQDDSGYAEFLKKCFPTLSEDRVDTLLRENDNNPEIVLDVILNEMYLESEQQVEDSLHSTSPPTSVMDSNCDEDNSLVSGTSKHRKKKKRQKKKPNSFVFQTNGHRLNSDKSPSPNSPATLSLSPSCWNTPWVSSPSIQSNNPWSKFEYDSIDDDKLIQLASVFPDHDVESLRQILVTCKGEVQEALEVLLSAGTDRVRNGEKRKTVTQVKSTQRAPYTPPSPNGVAQAATHNKKRNGNTIGSKNNNGTSSSLRIPNNSKIYDDNDSDGIVDYEDGYDHGYCRKEASRFYKLRNEAFRKANQSYRKRDGVASYYSDEGWRFDAEMRRWNLRAARSLVKKHSEKKSDEHILDLHGCTVNESLTIVKEWLNDWYSKKRIVSAKPLKPLKIITGKGNHSPNGIAKLPSAINKFLVDNNWTITERRGYVLVHGFRKI